MKALKCEMCGSTNLIKQDGVFVCQSCGTKYSVEEAKKMMVEGTVDVTGSTVKVDSSDELKNLYELARRAKETNNAENAAKYYGMILVKDPRNWEATFYTTFFEAWGCKIGEISLSAEKVYNNYQATIDLFNSANLNEEEKQKSIDELSAHILSLSDMMHSAAIRNYKDIDGQVRAQFSPEYMNHAFCASNLLFKWADLLEGLSAEKYKSTILRFWETGVDQTGISLKVCLDTNSSAALQGVAASYEAKIKSLNPDYVEKNYKSGCYVATAIYGSYDCPEVWTLRRFRDNSLDKSMFGRTFIKTYYGISPILVKWFGETSWFKAIWKPVLDRMVKRLQNNGVESTPYRDKY